ncbi:MULTISPECIES: flagellar basal body rod protein FlgC [Stappiaceae]|jgi:flagellar basal-body rod protein FlgC|uniref:Flagellar basal-body rod protein FlgC n=2 Tax=Roseibium alexandrii TaxID=388408 RepID=A0A0M7A155_9HYPH|nr:MULTISPECIES: flagellar basal body rod protein FlgC [Stappiaceae]OJJ11084.1 flagellar basal body rod protein FlgC [Alphaproteobacteria bacterium AO1-B]EEE45256.1 flagellar basal-body rod protein FlgC [Roseibium alexandrii DFL-11]MBO9419880.1 flagellar basal body rod protein FlgC [Labrenzia sp. R4_2]MBO9425254.1 flagellar basal body rod protein FlgC [Labrenzia sp. R4_1]CTQ68186.1 Putative proximal rod protein [Roseibium alexandrii]
MDLMKSLFISASGLKAQNGRMRVIAENIANANSTARTPDEEPYRRKIPTFQSEFDKQLGADKVELGRIVEDKSAFKSTHMPGHPAADENGYVLQPNVSTLVESADMREAQRSYEANLNVIETTRKMLQRTIDILRA